MTLREIIDAVLEEVGYSTTGATQDVRVRLRRRVNEHHRRLLSTPTLVRLLRESYSVIFTSVAGQAVYGLSPSVGRINGIYETTNDVKLEQRSLTWLREQDPGLTGAGVPEVYIPRGYSPVKTQPSSSYPLYAVSTSANDTEIAVTLEGHDGDRPLSITATLTGTTPVYLGYVEEVTKFFASPHAEGAILLTDDDGGEELARITVGSTAVKYLSLQLWPTPQDAVEYWIDATRESTDLVDDNDEPLLPRDFHHLLVLAATADEMRMRDDTRYEALRIDMEQGKRDLNNWIWNNADYTPAGTRGAKMSRLGAWFPAGS